MKICTKCVLPETFPGIRFNQEGVCSFCQEFKGIDHLRHKQEEYRLKFEELLRRYKEKFTYDAIMSYSGGKDSTYTLILLKKRYGLNLLAITMDNGFISPQAFLNIRNVVENLGIDHIFFKPLFDLLKKIYLECAQDNIYPVKTLERASAICTSCMGIVKFCLLKTALEKNIPFIAFGWSPGQAPITSSIMKNNPGMLKMMQDIILLPLRKVAGDEINPYFLEERHFGGTFEFPYNISPLAFLNYSEEIIFEEIQHYGWHPPLDTDANSTNCLLNSFANIIHKDKFRFHPYAFEMAKLVREGYIDKKSAMEKISKPEDKSTIEAVKSRIGLE